MLFFADTVLGTFTDAGEHQSCKQSSKSIFVHSIICFNAALNYSFPLPLLSNLAYFQPTLYHTVSFSKNSSLFSSKLLQQTVDLHTRCYSRHITHSAANICSAWNDNPHCTKYMYIHISIKINPHVREVTVFIWELTTGSNLNLPPTSVQQV